MLNNIIMGPRFAGTIIITEYFKQVVFDFRDTVAQMSPYLLFGFFMAGVLSILLSQKFVEKHLGGGGV